MTTHPKWTSERVEQLRTYVNAGLTCSQIALEIGVTRNAVIGKIYRLGLSPGRPAAAPALRHPPRVRPRMTQRRIVHAIFAELRHVAEAAGSSECRERGPLFAARPRAGQVSLADQRSG